MEVKIKLQQCAPEIIRITIHVTGTIKDFSYTTFMTFTITAYSYFYVKKWVTLTIPNAFSLIRKVAGLLSYKLPFHT